MELPASHAEGSRAAAVLGHHPLRGRPSSDEAQAFCLFLFCLLSCSLLLVRNLSPILLLVTTIKPHWLTKANIGILISLD